MLAVLRVGQYSCEYKKCYIRYRERKKKHIIPVNNIPVQKLVDKMKDDEWHK